VKETSRAMLAYVVAVRDNRGEAWQTKDEAQGAVEVLWEFARDAGVRLDRDELDAETRRTLEEETAALVSEAPRMLRQIDEKARRVGHASLSIDDTSRRARRRRCDTARTSSATSQATT
jgi:hypothetical protein